MTNERWWVALVAFERREEAQEILPDWAHGAACWMIARALDGETAREILVRDVENCGLRVVEIKDEREVFGDDEIEEIDDALVANFHSMASAKQSAWGTLYCYMGEGEA